MGTTCVQCIASSDCGDAGPCNSYFLMCGSCAANSDCPPEVPICVFEETVGYICTDGGF
jgi:hypothetical protein